jgi:hypothetical protein
LPPENLDLTARHLDLLHCLKLSHLRVDLRLSGESWGDELRQASAETTAIGCSLEAAVFVSGSAERELAALAAQIARDSPSIRRGLILHKSEPATPDWCVMCARRVLGGSPNARRRRISCLYPSIRRSTHLTMHRWSKRAPFESLLSRTHQMFGGMPLVVGPVNLKPRFQAYAPTPVTELARGGLPQQVETRQWSLFGAAWIVGSFANVLTSGAVAVTYYETQGLRGLIHTDRRSPAPHPFELIRPVVFPIYHVFADVAEFAGGSIHSCVSSEPLKECALALSRDTAKAMLVANMTCDAMEVHISGNGSCTGGHSLGERSAVAAMTRPETFRALRSLVPPVRDVIPMLLYLVVRLDLN